MEIDVRTCRVCGNPTLKELAGFRQLNRVTSDCLPFRSGGRLLTCESCGAAQSPADEQWLREIREIYSSYYAYHQSEGIEQCVPDDPSGRLTPRSEVFVNRLLMLDDVPSSGKLLDVGCGTGGTLRAFAKRGGWQLFGLELDDRNLRFLEAIENFEKLYIGDPDELPTEFALITLVHTLEHFPDPVSALKSLRSKLASGGRLFIEVPNAAANPFDYLIADHMVHFTAATLTLLLERAGFRVNCLSTDWVAKELSATAKPDVTPSATSGFAPSQPVAVSAQVDWLCCFAETARATMVEARDFGLFGSSIAATWLGSTLGDGVTFFVDEDSNRVGRVHMGRPILSPAEVPAGAIVLLPMIPEIATRIAGRLSSARFELRMPPPLPL